MGTNDTRLLSVREAAERLGISKETGYRLVRSGELPAVKVGGSIRVDPHELAQYVYGPPEPEAA